MSSVDQLQYLSWLVYVVLFVLVLVRTIRLPTPAHIHMTLFFGAVAVVILSSSLASTFHASPPGWLVNLITPIALLALGYLLLRLVRDFTDVPRLLVRAVELGMLVSIAAVVFVPVPLPVSVVLALVGYLVLVIGYDAWAFARQATRTQGVTRRRMQAVSLASLSIVAALITAGLGVLAPDAAGFWAELGAIFGLGSGVCYFIGFAPPTWLRRAWQEPEVRAFLSRAAHLAGSTAGPGDILAQLERGAADAFGAPAARIALWDPESRRLRIATAGDAELPARLARAWTQQRASLVTELDESEAHAASLTGVAEARAALFAPITAYDKRMGVLVVFAQRAPVFANSDLELIELLADE
ncbi:MAG TPA: GAF domain-containing protein, partial [Chloroflexota bacterium]